MNGPTDLNALRSFVRIVDAGSFRGAAAHERSGRLVAVLDDFCAPPLRLAAVYPSARLAAVTVRSFLDFLAARLSPPPWT